MRVIYTEPALKELDAVLTYIKSENPRAAVAVETRIRAVVARIANYPESARRVLQRPGIRVSPLVRYPYKIFYLVTPEAVEILHIHHSSRQAPKAK